MSSFREMTSELAGYLPGLSPFLAEKFVSRAYVDICNAKNWNWLQEDSAIVCPTQITAGAVAIVQFTATVTCNAAASAALLTQAEETTEPGLTNLQIRFGATSPAAGQVYNILSVNVTTPAALVLTLDRMVMETTNAAIGYQCYRCYVVPYVTQGTFLRWESVVDVVNGWKLKANWTSSQFDRRDPQRQAQGMAYYIGSYETNRIVNAITGATAPNPNQQAGIPSYELWPHPTAGQTFYTRMRLKGQGFTSPTQEPPTNIIDDQLIIQRALARYAYPWAMSNVANFPTLKGANWPTLIASALAGYNELLMTAKRLDDEQGLGSVWARGHGLRTRMAGWQGMTDYPIDSNFLQSHLVNF